jgi:hypothetical protein
MFTWDQSDYGISFSLAGPYGGVEDSVHQGERTGHIYLCRMNRETQIFGDKWIIVRFAPKATNEPPLESYALLDEPRLKGASKIVVESKKSIFLGSVPALLFLFSNESDEPILDLRAKCRGYWLVADANGLRYKVMASDEQRGDVLNDAELGSVLKTLKITDMHGQPPPVITNPPRYRQIDFNANSLTTFGVTLGEKLEISTTRADKQGIQFPGVDYAFGTNNGQAQFPKGLDGSTSAIGVFAMYHNDIIDEIEVITRDDYFYKYLRDELNHRTNSTVFVTNGEYTVNFGGRPVRISMSGGEGRQDHIFFRRDDLIKKGVEAYQQSERIRK